MKIDIAHAVWPLALLACSSSSTTASTTDAGSDTAGNAVDFSFYVVEYENAPDGNAKPLPGAHALFAIGGDTPTEATSDADGLVTFKSVDFFRGDGTLTVAVAGHDARSFVGVNPSLWAAAEVRPDMYAKAGSLGVVLMSVLAPPTVTLSGAILGKMDPANYVIISVTHGVTSYDDVTNTYSLQARPGVPLTLVAVEYAISKTPPVGGFADTKLRWSKVDVGVLSGDKTLDLDWSKATPLTPKTVTGTVAVPGGKTGPFQYSVPTLTVATLEHGLYLGSRNSATPAPDGDSFTLTAEYVDLGSALTDHVDYRIDFDAAGGAESEVTFLGPPPPTFAIDDMPLPPTLPAGAKGCATPIAVSGVQMGARSRVILSVADSTQQERWAIGSLYGGPIPSALGCAPFPTESDVALPSSGLRGFIQVASQLSTTVPLFYAYIAQTNTFSFTR